MSIYIFIDGALNFHLGTIAQEVWGTGVSNEFQGQTLDRGSADKVPQ